MKKLLILVMFLMCVCNTLVLAQSEWWQPILPSVWDQQIVPDGTKFYVNPSLTRYGAEQDEMTYVPVNPTLKFGIAAIQESENLLQQIIDEGSSYHIIMGYSTAEALTMRPDPMTGNPYTYQYLPPNTQDGKGSHIYSNTPQYLASPNAYSQTDPFWEFTIEIPSNLKTQHGSVFGPLEKDGMWHGPSFNFPPFFADGRYDTLGELGIWMDKDDDNSFDGLIVPSEGESFYKLDDLLKPGTLPPKNLWNGDTPFYQRKFHN